MVGITLLCESLTVLESAAITEGSRLVAATPFLSLLSPITLGTPTSALEPQFTSQSRIQPVDCPMSSANDVC
jgi:hypothetical protein